MRKRRMLGSALLACVALSGCGAEETPSRLADTAKATPKATKKATPVDAPPGTWAFHYHGATGYVLIPAPRTDPRLTEIEGYRKRAKAKPVCYAIVEVDNTRGTRELFMDILDSDAPGDDAEYQSARWWVALWEKNRGGGNKPLEAGVDDLRARLRHPYDIIQYAPGQPRPGYKDYGLPEKGTIVFAVDDVATPAGIRRCGKQQREPSYVALSLEVDDDAPVEATEVPTSATP